MGMFQCFGQRRGDDVRVIDFFQHTNSSEADVGMFILYRFGECRNDGVGVIDFFQRSNGTQTNVGMFIINGFS